METLTGPLAEALACHREELNARFLARRRAGVELDGPNFLEHLATTVDPLVRAVAAALPEKTESVSLALYDASLDLFASKWLGPEAKNQNVREAWQKLLPRAPVLLAREPARLAGSISNAVVNLSSAPETRPEAWLARMAELAPQCPSATALLQCGNVLAWQAGMPQYRAGALAIARRLDARLVAAALGLPDDLAAEPLAAAIDKLANDPWLTPREAIDSTLRPARLRIVRQAGGFCGFGGPFLRPPKVALAGGEFIVSDQEKTWRLFADVFGAAFVRTEAPETPSGDRRAVIDSRGAVRWDGETALFPELIGACSYACDGRTLAATVADSHLVFLAAKA